jgi:hypothetical protein
LGIVRIGHYLDRFWARKQLRRDKIRCPYMN